MDSLLVHAFFNLIGIGIVFMYDGNYLVFLDFGESE